MLYAQNPQGETKSKTHCFKAIIVLVLVTDQCWVLVTLALRYFIFKIFVLPFQIKV